MNVNVMDDSSSSQEASLNQMLDDIMELEHLGFNCVESRETFRDRLEVFPDGVIVKPQIGYITSEIWRQGEEKFALDHRIRDMHDSRGTTFYISSMVVHPSHRGKRLGEQFVTTLMRQVKDKYPHITEAILIVNTLWVHAHSIYVRLGFVEVNRLIGFFSDGDAIVMTRSMSSLPSIPSS
jgi:ribosomal-protein-alanine N-acetyltransferase